MWSYTARRILYAVPIAFGVSVVCFSLVYPRAGRPAQMVLPAGRPQQTSRSEAGLRLRQAAAGAVLEMARARR